MPSTQDDIQKAIEETERDLAALKAAYKVMQRRDNRAAKSTTNATPVTPAIGESGVINLDEVKLPGKTVRRGPTLQDDIRGLIGRFGDQEFTVNHVDAVLRKMGKGSDAKHYKNRISTTIRKLTEEGLITLSHQGIGSDPHRYLVIHKEHKKEIGDERSDAKSSPTLLDRRPDQPMEPTA